MGMALPLGSHMGMCRVYEPPFHFKTFFSNNTGKNMMSASHGRFLHFPMLPATVLLATTCVLADHLLAIPEFSMVDLIRALTDNLTHCIVGMLTWVIATYSDLMPTKRYVMEALACGVISSAVDVDHFLAAKSLNLKVGSNL